MNISTNQQFLRLHIAIVFLICFFANARAAPTIPPDVVSVFDDYCTGCHAGELAEGNLDLSENQIWATLVGQPSQQKPEIMRIAPANPQDSYLMMKIRHDADIEGEPMPLGNDKIPSEDIEIITNWIASLSAATTTTIPQHVRAFAGWTVGNTPTAEVLKKGDHLFRISHRFIPKIDEGEEAMYGIDGLAVIMISLGYAITDNLLVNLGRSNAKDNVELSARYRILREIEGNLMPSVAFQGVLNWESVTVEGKERLRDDVLMYSLQAITSKQVLNDFSLVVVPGILINPNTQTMNEDPLITIGLGGRYHFGDGVSLVGDWIPIVSGFSSARSYAAQYDLYKRFDSWTLGIEKQAGGHVFQVFMTNSEGISYDQFLNGGDLDLAEGDMRLGFAIYRILRF